MWHLDGVETAGSESLTLTLSLADGDESEKVGARSSVVWNP